MSPPGNCGSEVLLWLASALEGKSRRGRLPDVKGGGWFVDPGGARARSRPRLCSCFWGDAEQPPSRVGPGLIYSRVSRAGEIELFDHLPDDPREMLVLHDRSQDGGDGDRD